MKHVYLDLEAKIFVSQVQTTLNHTYSSTSVCQSESKWPLLPPRRLDEGLSVTRMSVCIDLVCLFVCRYKNRPLSDDAPGI